MLGVLAVAAFFVFAFRRVHGTTPEADATRFSDLAPFRSFGEDGHGGWVGELGPGWEGYARPALVPPLCEQLRLRLQSPSGVPIVLLSWTGDPVGTCQ